MLIGERTKNIYRLGDTVKVRCSRVDIDNREIFFDIEKVDEFKDTAYNKDYREKKYKEGIENEYF